MKVRHDVPEYQYYHKCDVMMSWKALHITGKQPSCANLLDKKLGEVRSHYVEEKQANQLGYGSLPETTVLNVPRNENEREFSGC